MPVSAVERSRKMSHFVMNHVIIKKGKKQVHQVTDEDGNDSYIVISTLPDVDERLGGPGPGA